MADPTPARRRRLAALVPVVVLVVALGGCGTRRPTGDTGAGALGPLGANGAGHRFFEVYEPEGRPRGTMLLFHGGGWLDRPGDARRGMVGPALVFRAQGWRVVNVAYGPAAGAGSTDPDPRPIMRDVVAFYDQAKRAFGGPVCASGPSAGGHLAAMLAAERPGLTCAVDVGGPVDLVTMEDDTNRQGRSFLAQTFGTNEKVLARWSPARRWPRSGAPEMFVAGAKGDPVVPPDQARRFAEVDRDAEVAVLEGASLTTRGAVGFAHSLVTGEAKRRFQGRQDRFLARVVPPVTGRAEQAHAPARGRACDSALPEGDLASGDRDDRWRLLRAGEAWTQHADTALPMAATSGCSGSAARQDEGLSVWAFPARGLRVPAGGEASQTLVPRGGAELHVLQASLRGFLAHPRDWRVGLFASTATTGPVEDPVAVCDRGRCRGLRAVPGGGGTLLSAGGAGDPDATDTPPVQRFALPAGTRRVSWRLTCVAPSGCALDGSSKDARERDPVGHPAILSFYELQWR